MKTNIAKTSDLLASEINNRVDFNTVRYAQCWEDADILLEGLDIQPEDTCLSIASAGDNALSMLSKGPKKVIALDLNPAQLSCLALRVAAYKTLTHSELLELIGSNPSKQRQELYQQCRKALSENERIFWDARLRLIEQGAGSIGKFERYFKIFARRVMPLIHSRDEVETLLKGGNEQERIDFYESTWNSSRWKLFFRLFFSRQLMGKLGRDPEFFKYVEGSVSDKILNRADYAFTKLNPYDNPYLQWILKGEHLTAYPHALRAENFDNIRNNLDRLQWHCASIEAYLEEHPDNTITKYNLSDIFEYMSENNYETLLNTLVRSSCPGGRLLYWNMLVPRSRPEKTMKEKLLPLSELSQKLFLQDKAFFYSALHVEEVC